MPSVLFVDDEPNIIEGMGRMLRGMCREWQLHFALGAADGLAVMAQQHINIVVSDIRMPEMDGAVFLSRVRQLYPHTIRVILSGVSDEEVVLDAAKTAHQFLAKPCSAETIKHTLECLFRLRDFINNEKIEGLIAGTELLPSMPAVYLKLLKEIQGYLLWCMPAIGFAILWNFQLQLYGFLTCNFRYFYLTTNKFRCNSGG